MNVFSLFSSVEIWTTGSGGGREEDGWTQVVSSSSAMNHKTSHTWNESSLEFRFHLNIKHSAHWVRPQIKIKCLGMGISWFEGGFVQEWMRKNRNGLATQWSFVFYSIRKTDSPRVVDCEWLSFRVWVWICIHNLCMQIVERFPSQNSKFIRTKIITAFGHQPSSSSSSSIRPIVQSLLDGIIEIAFPLELPFAHRMGRRRRLSGILGSRCIVVIKCWCSGAESEWVDANCK